MDFRKMAKAEKALPPDMLEEIIRNAQYSVVSMTGDDGYPYGLAVNIAYIEGALYFHGSATGKKLESIRKNPLVCVTTAVDVVVDAQKHNTYYKSAMCFGRAKVLEGNENYYAGEQYGAYYGLESESVKSLLVRSGAKEVAMVKIEVEHISIRINEKR